MNGKIVSVLSVLIIAFMPLASAGLSEEVKMVTTSAETRTCVRAAP